MIRWLRIEPALVGAAAAAVYAAGAMLYRAYVSKDAVLDWDLLVAAGTAVWAVYTRSQVTPIALPRDGQGRALTPSQVP